MAVLQKESSSIRAGRMSNVEDMMKPYTADTNAGRTKACDDINHKTADGGLANRAATAKAQRKAARQQARKQACGYSEGDLNAR